jgi:plasmid maintenance system antidote protein VapI
MSSHGRPENGEDDARRPAHVPGSGNRLEALQGDRKGQYSVRINDQWRICFVWEDGAQMMSNSSTTTDLLDPIHPGEVLMEDFIKGLDGKRRITADTALRLGKYFGTSPEFWMNLQTHYDLRAERRNHAAIDAIRPLRIA